MKVPHTHQPKRLECHSSRLPAHFVHDPTEADIAIIGLPDDTGITLNNGRPGAQNGPAAFRAALTTYGHPHPAGKPLPKVYDAGDLETASELDQTHARVTEAAAALHAAGLFPIAIGGGHDLTYPFVTAAANHHGTLAGIYLDAHLDVRPEPGSGMPFHRILTEGCASELHALGIDSLAASAERTAWFHANGGHINDLNPTDPDEALPQGPLFASLDLDVIDQSSMPAVSSMNPNGWSTAFAEQWVRRLAIMPNLVCFDIMELSPPHDERGRSARTAARLFLAFLQAFSSRTNTGH